LLPTSQLDANPPLVLVFSDESKDAACTDSDSLLPNRCPSNEASTFAPWPRRWDNAQAQRYGVSAQRRVSVQALICGGRHDFPALISCLVPILGMYALRERRQHVTQEDFEFAIAKVSILLSACLANIVRVLLGSLGKLCLLAVIRRLQRD
jgi:hypothetical protein